MPAGEVTAGIGNPIPACIRFNKKGKNGQLLAATVEPDGDSSMGFPANTIHEWIRSQGCDGWLLDEEVVSLFVREMRRLKVAKEYVLAERKDCQIELQVSPDRLKAWICIAPAFGGEPLTELLVRQTLENQNVRYGINEARLQEIIQEGGCEKEVIAEGIPPTQGEKARFEHLVRESEHKGVPQERKDGSVDYKDLGLFLSVIKGAPLLKRIPPTQGIPGTGIDGNSLPALGGADRALIPGVGAAISKEDPNIIIATRDGQPIFLENSVRVDSTLELDAVNHYTGNVTFDGNILVRGPVESGFTVKAGQDLTILDTVEGADLIAGRNLVLLTGVYGKSKTKISVEGKLEARFLSDCTIRCGGDIEVTDLIAHCMVDCEGSVHLGKYGGKGQFYGGKLLALREIRAQILGAVSESTTLVELAPPRSLILRRDDVEDEIVKTGFELAAAQKELQSIATLPLEQGGPKINELKKRVAHLAEKLEELKKEQVKISEKLKASRNGRIKASAAHRGVILCIGSHRQTIGELMGDLVFQGPPEEKPSPQALRK
jgi:uncharacterized protein